MNLKQRSAHKFNCNVRRERDSRLWWKCVLGLILGVFLVSGFAYAAQQHFEAYECGKKNVEKQRLLERLRAERQELLAAREAALAPQQLKRLAQKIGMQTPDAKQINTNTSSSFEVEAATAAATNQPLLQNEEADRQTINVR